MDKLSTVNIITREGFREPEIEALTSFPDTPEGNIEAEKLFVKLVKERVPTDVLNKEYEEYIEQCIKNGIIEFTTTSILIVHSN